MIKVPQKETRQLLARFPALIVERTRRHLKIRHPITGAFVIAPLSGSDWRGIKNLRAALVRLSREPLPV